MKYIIRYRHRSPEFARSLLAARQKARLELGVVALLSVSCDDGIYCYRCRADLRADDTGAGAAAVISLEAISE